VKSVQGCEVRHSGIQTGLQAARLQGKPVLCTGKVNKNRMKVWKKSQESFCTHQLSHADSESYIWKAKRVDGCSVYYYLNKNAFGKQHPLLRCYNRTHSLPHLPERSGECGILKGMGHLFILPVLEEGGRRVERGWLRDTEVQVEQPEQ
jgi:hypothetical protein